MNIRPALLFTAIALLSGCGGPDIASTAPGGGGLEAGQSVLVDDGKCPTGQVNKVTGAPSLTASRSYVCVARPKS